MLSQIRETLTDDADEECTYIFTLLPASKGLKLFGKLSNLAIPILSAAMSSGLGSSLVGADGNLKEDLSLSDLKESDLSALIQAGHDLVTSIMENGGDALCREILSGVSRMQEGSLPHKNLGDRASFDAVYRGNYGEMLLAIKQALIHNFLKAAKSAGKKLFAAA